MCDARYSVLILCYTMTTISTTTSSNNTKCILMRRNCMCVRERVCVCVSVRECVRRGEVGEIIS